MTIEPAILEKLESLPESLQLKVLQYIDSLIENREQYGQRPPGCKPAYGTRNAS